MEQKLRNLERDLCERYRRLGEDILETAEREERKISDLTDSIIKTGRKLEAIRLKTARANNRMREKQEENKR